MTSFWSGWVIVLTSLTLILVTWLLFANRKRNPIDEKTTGHIYDGIEEWDNPLPGWWFAMFVITIVWGIGYLVAYPGMGNFPGVLGWSSATQHEQEVAVADEKFRAMRDKYLAMSIEDIYQDPKVRKMGMRIYGNNCSQCHGLDAAGALGFPNLTDNDWLYGGSPEAIKHTLVNGRQAAMPPWESILGEQGIMEATAYVLSLNSREADDELVAAGEKHYQTYCVACHGPEAKGNPLMGAPNLTNGIWLYGGSEEQIAHSLRIGRNGQMPAFGNTLSEDKIHLVSAYIYGLSK
ncbi:cytochrome-c oxidase, cbb3-type subunit III [Congregibacter litoralis]|uniref:Cbb3-type cytochrome c oxidase subunit n=1 Tax=Congregibacter litoralis KT71 TaxID=314285 RepID=A4A3W6_9GAMM|nr:cytochrome-c oxidase, cbb3-type subunit III [Congregibacter litoralis]EAQ99389.1 cytochrome c oxidase, cbb3-type, subunit III [Congregibacter litoralis KT71]